MAIKFDLHLEKNLKKLVFSRNLRYSKNGKADKSVGLIET